MSITKYQFWGQKELLTHVNPKLITGIHYVYKNKVKTRCFFVVDNIEYEIETIVLEDLKTAKSIRKIMPVFILQSKFETAFSKETAHQKMKYASLPKFKLTKQQSVKIIRYKNFKTDLTFKDTMFKWPIPDSNVYGF